MGLTSKQAGEEPGDQDLSPCCGCSRPNAEQRRDQEGNDIDRLTSKRFGHGRDGQSSKGEL